MCSCDFWISMAAAPALCSSATSQGLYYSRHHRSHWFTSSSGSLGRIFVWRGIWCFVDLQFGGCYALVCLRNRSALVLASALSLLGYLLFPRFHQSNKLGIPFIKSWKPPVLNRAVSCAACSKYLLCSSSLELSCLSCSDWTLSKLVEPFRLTWQDSFLFSLFLVLRVFPLSNRVVRCGFDLASSIPWIEIILSVESWFVFLEVLLTHWIRFWFML
jgi:hypothetical protein